MLDALLAEAAPRGGLDPADGMAVIPAERLVGLPLEPTRPVVIVPLAALRVPHLPAPPAPLPGRHGHGGDDPSAVLRRLDPAWRLLIVASCSAASWYFAIQPSEPPFVADGSMEFSSTSFAKSAPGFAAAVASWPARTTGTSAETNSITCHPKADWTGSSSWPGVRPGA